MNRYQTTLDRLSQKNEGAFIPFVVLGDPNVDLSLKIIQCLIESGADALELGLAFSDPVADGPVVQRADMRALRNGCKTVDALQIISQIRKDYPDTPIGILTYANLVVHKSAEGFYKNLSEAGVDSLLIADVPTLEIKPFLDLANKHDVSQVMISPPNIDDERLKFIADNTSGYVYVVTRKGVTGADESISLSSKDVFENLKALGGPPGFYGFGISTPAHVKDALSAGARGAISGSAVTKIVEQHQDEPTKMLEVLSGFVEEMKAATKAV